MPGVGGCLDEEIVIFDSFYFHRRGVDCRTQKIGNQLNMRTNYLTGCVLAAALAIACGCAKLQGQRRDSSEAAETKVRLEQTPPAVRKTIEAEMVGAKLEDIAGKSRGEKLFTKRTSFGRVKNGKLS